MSTTHPSDANEPGCPHVKGPTATTDQGESTGTHSQIRWMLPELMAQRNHMTQAELVRALEEDGAHVITRTQVWRLVTRLPTKISLDLVGALCRILPCTPSELLGWEAPPVEQDLNPTLTHIAKQGRQYAGAGAVPPIPSIPDAAPRLNEAERARIVGPPARAYRAHPLGGKPE